MTYNDAPLSQTRHAEQSTMDPAGRDSLGGFAAGSPPAAASAATCAVMVLTSCAKAHDRAA